jgi:hypothetical protein
MVTTQLGEVAVGNRTIDVSRPRGRVEGGWSVRLTITDPFPDEREWRDLRGRLRECSAKPSVFGVLERYPMDPLLAGLIAERPPRPANQRAGGRGLLKAYWEELGRAANATPGLAGRWRDWKALQRYVKRCELRERENREALERFDAEWSAAIEQRDTARRRVDPGGEMGAGEGRGKDGHA